MQKPLTIKKRLFRTNMLMVVVPALITLGIGLVCVGMMWLFVVGGGNMHIDDRGDFYQAATALSEPVRHRLKRGPLFDASGAGAEK